MHSTWTTPAWVLLAFASLIMISTADSAPAGGLDLEERVRYQDLIEQAYAEQRGASASDATKTLAIDAVPTDAEIRAKVETQLRMADALDRLWGQRIVQDDYQAEYERILAHSNDRAMLGRLLDALDRNPDAVAACLIEPILVRRAIHRAFCWDDAIHAELRQTAETELLTGNEGDELDWFTGERTLTEWRLTAGDESLGMEFEDGVQIRKVNQEQWDRLLESQSRTWAIAESAEAGVPLLRFSPLDEAKECFSASVILERGPARIQIATHTWWKRTFSDWWYEHEDEFSARIVGPNSSIALQPAQLTPQPENSVKTHSVTADTWFALDSSDPDAPSARDQHTAAWTGSQMIIWGGTNGTQVFRSGGVYDPATDSWTPTSQSGDCPTARIGHTASWRETGNMFVWGGWNGTDYFDTGSKYDPSTNAWTAMANDAETPAARYGHAAFLTGNTLEIWGGKKTSSKTNTGASYLFSGNTWHEWSVEPNTPAARDQMVAVIEDGPLIFNLLVWGGAGGSSTLGDGGYYDLNPGGWVTMDSAGAPTPRFGHTGVPSGGVCTDEPHIFIWGGFAPYDTSARTNTGAEFNSFPWGGWIGPTPTGTNVPAGRYNHSAVMDTSKDLMVVWGGTTTSGSTSSGGILDLCNDSWVATDTTDPDCPSARAGHTAVWTGKTMLVWGGSDGSALGDGGVYTHCWGTPTGLPTPTVADEDPCAADGIRISWSFEPTWKDYDVHRRVAILRDSAVIASDLLPSDGSYLDTTAVEDQSYDYQIHFINSCGESITTTSESGVDESSSAPTVTVPPTAVDADGCSAGSGIDITWPADPDDWGDDETDDRKYRVWRWQNSVTGWIALGSQLDYGTTIYHDPNPNFGKYRIKYINGCDKNTDSPETEMIYDLAGATPTVSQTVTAVDADTCDHTGNSISWPADPDDWNDGGTGDRLYRVRRSTDGVTFNPIGSNLTYGTTSFVDTNAVADQQYHYQVRYKNGCDLSTDSGTDTATDVDGDDPVTGFNATASDPDTCDDAGVAITWPQDGALWGDGDSGTRSYEIVRGSTTIHTGIAYGTTTFTDTTGENGTAYTYRVRMVNGCDLSGLSGISSSVADLPAAPSITGTNNTAADIDECDVTGVLITWNADPGDGWGDDGGSTRTYQVFRDGVVLQAGISHGTTELTDTTGTAGTDYLYTVRYVNCGGQYAETAGATAADHQGAAPTVTANSEAVDTDNCIDGGITLTWPADPEDWGDNEAGTRTYDVVRDGTAVQTGIAYGTTSFIDTTGDNGTAYFYQLRYSNGCGLDSTTTGDNGNDRPIAPAAPVNNTATDADACATTGVLVTWSADPDGPWGDGGGTHTYEVRRDGVALQSGIAYGTTAFTDTTGTPDAPYTYSVRYVNCGNLHSETTGVMAADTNGTPLTPTAPVVHDASACAQDGVWITWTPSAGAATYDLRVDSAIEIISVTDPTGYDPGDSMPHTYEVRANGATCTGYWSESTTLADIIDPDAQFCDGFETENTGGWSNTTP